MPILVVDDEAEARRLTATLLRKMFPTMCVVEAANGLDALKCVNELRPHVIVSDVRMPFGDGTMLVEALRRRPALARVPVILLSSDPELSEVAASLEVAGHLAKPVSPLALARAIGRCLGIQPRLAAAATAATLTRRAVRARSKRG